jgi:hypothetical protein
LDGSISVLTAGPLAAVTCLDSRNGISTFVKEEMLKQIFAW